MIFRDREHAGILLAERLRSYAGTSALVLALPRGGVPVGYQVARALGLPLDVIVARKLGVPGQPELGIGAIAPGGVRVVDERLLSMLKITPGELEEVTRREAAELRRRIERYRAGRPEPDVRARTAIIVDDGLATGVTAVAAVNAIQRQGPSAVVLAAPAAAAETVRRLRPLVDELVVLQAPEDFRAVGMWYEHFDQTPDEEVLRLLGETPARAASGGQPGTVDAEYV